MSKHVFEKREVFVVTDKEIEKIVESHYGREYDFKEGETTEHINGSYLVPHVVFGKNISPVQQNILDKFVRGERSPYFLAYVLMQDMCNKEIIPEGVYIVTIGLED